MQAKIAFLAMCDDVGTHQSYKILKLQNIYYLYIHNSIMCEKYFMLFKNFFAINTDLTHTPGPLQSIGRSS